MTKTFQTTPFEELAKTMKPHVRAAAAVKASRLIRQIGLADLRKHLGITQSQLSAALRISQPGLSKLERQTDMQLSTLAKAIEGLGGKLKLVAEFPDGDVELAPFAAPVPIAAKSKRRVTQPA